MKIKKISLKILLFDVSILILITGFISSILGSVKDIEISRVVSFSTSLRLLPYYSLLSLSRVMIALFISFITALFIGYLMVHDESIEKILHPIIDVLQSIPVLSFMPAVTIAIFRLLGGGRVALELSSIILIATGQIWNLIFAFYSSVRSLPETIKETSDTFSISTFMRFYKVELPFAVPSLVYNLMLSSAGGWFFLMACEMLVIGGKSYGMPGLGSLIYIESQKGNINGIFLGFGAIFSIITLLHFLLWKPLLVWSEKFKTEQLASVEKERESVIYDLARRSYLFNIIRIFFQRVLEKFFVKRTKTENVFFINRKMVKMFWGILILFAAVILVYWIYPVIGQVRLNALKVLPFNALLSLSRVLIAVSIAGFIAIPLGVFIGYRRKTGGVWESVTQILASIPASSLYPVIISLILTFHLPKEVAVIVFLVLSGFWYILFNAMAGASKIPSDFIELSKVYRIKGWLFWKNLIIPSVSSDIITGFLTASGGAWNATIIAEYFTFRGEIIDRGGLGSLITKATFKGDVGSVFVATLTMAVIVVLFNRLVWKRLYKTAEEKFTIETY